MGNVFKRGDFYYMDDVVDGVRIKRSLKTKNWQLARKKRNDVIKEGRVSSSGKSEKQTFKVALEDYLVDRGLTMAAKTVSTDRERAKPLVAFFASTRLGLITVESIEKYQSKRKRAGVSNRTVNMEVGLVRRLLTKHRLWKRIGDRAEEEEINLSLDERSDVGQALEESEELRLLEVAQTRPSWLVAYCATVVSLNTTLRKSEILGLQWKHVDLTSDIPTISVRRATTKSDKGERTIALNCHALLAFHQLRERCEFAVQVEGSEIKEILPEHFVFPACENGHVDLCKPMKTWSTAWTNLKKKAGLEWVRFHDLRHTSVTNLLESGQSDQVVTDIAGHVSRRMLQRYSHIRLKAKQAALAGLERHGKSESTQSIELEEEVESLLI